MMTLDDALDSFDQVVVEMPAVRDLPGVWRTERGAQLSAVRSGNRSMGR